MVSSTHIGELHLRIPIVGLSCAASEGRSLERQLVKVPGVLQVYVNPATERVYLQCDPGHYDPEQILAQIRDAGVRPGTIERC